MGLLEIPDLRFFFVSSVVPCRRGPLRLSLVPESRLPLWRVELTCSTGAVPSAYRPAAVHVQRYLLAVFTYLHLLYWPGRQANKHLSIDKLFVHFV